MPATTKLAANEHQPNRSFCAINAAAPGPEHAAHHAVCSQRVVLALRPIKHADRLTRWDCVVGSGMGLLAAQYVPGTLRRARLLTRRQGVSAITCAAQGRQVHRLVGQHSKRGVWHSYASL